MLRTLYKGSILLPSLLICPLAKMALVSDHVSTICNTLMDNYRILEEAFQQVAYQDWYGISSQEQLAVAHLEVKYVVRHLNYLHKLNKDKERYYWYFYCKLHLVAMLNILGMHYNSYSAYGFDTGSFVGEYVVHIHINKFYLEVLNKKFVMCPSTSSHMTPYRLYANVFVVPFHHKWWDVLLANICKPDLMKYRVKTNKIYAHDLDIYTCTGATDYLRPIVYVPHCTCEEPKAHSNCGNKTLSKIKPLKLPKAITKTDVFTASSNLRTQLENAKFCTTTPVCLCVHMLIETN